MFRGGFALEETCPVCGVRFERAQGAWLGAAAIGYAAGAAFVAIVGLAEVVWGRIAALGVDPLWTIALLAVPVTALAYRPAKGGWFALLYWYGFVVPDGVDDGHGRRHDAG
jgi:hypothetical protein